MLHQSKAFPFVCSISYDMQVPLLSFSKVDYSSSISSPESINTSHSPVLTQKAKPQSLSISLLCSIP